MNNSIMAHIAKCFSRRSQNVLTFEVLFIIISSLIFLIAEIGTILAILKVYYVSVVNILIFVTFLVFLIFLLKHKVKIQKLTRHDWIALGIVFFFGCLNTYFFYDVFSGGMDYGIYTNAAIQLTKQHSFTVTENINFAGWFEISDVHQIIFYYAYPTWLAIHYGLFGLAGIQLSNFVLIIIGLLSIYFIAKHVFDSKIGIISIIFIATTYPMFWITRLTLSELLCFSTLWFGILSVILAYKQKNNLYLYPAILSFALALITRPEIIITYIFFIIIVLYLYFSKKEKSVVSKKIIVCLVLAIIPLLIYTYLVSPHYFIIITDMLRSPSIITNPVAHLAQDIQLSNDPISSHYPEFTFHMLSEYNLYWFIMFIPLAIIISRKFGKNAAIEFLFVCILAFPSFNYLIHPSSILFQPWFLRRYTVAVIPLSIMSMVVFLHFIIRQKQVRSIIFIMVLISNLVIAGPIITLSENAGMIKQVGDISSKFTSSDLVIVDQYSSSYKIADPMFFVYGIETRWINPMTFDEVFEEMSHFGHRNIYLITSNNSWIFGRLNQSSLQFTFDYDYSFESIKTTVNLHQKYGMGAIIYYTAPYSEVMEMIEVPHERILVNETFLVYRLISLPQIENIRDEK